MICAVVGCELIAEEVHAVETPAEASYPVCEMHLDQIRAGEDWAPGDESGFASSGQPTAIVMEEDLPWRLLAVSGVKAGGNRPGVLLRLTVFRNGASQELEFLVPQDEIPVLKMILEP